MTNSAALAEYLRDQARFRSDRGNEYDDDRNTRSGLALLDAADYAAQLGDDDPRLVRMANARVFVDDVPSFGNEALNVLRLWHFHQRSGSPTQLLDDLAAASERDWAEISDEASEQ